MQKTLLALGLSVVLLASSCPLSALAEPTQAPLSGTVIHSDQKNNSPTVNENDVKQVKKGTDLDMVVSSELTSGITAAGDEFFAKISKDVLVDGKVVIPKGTIVHGAVEEMGDPKRAGRNGYIGTRFDYMITPDGREIPISGDFTTRDGKGKAAAKVVGKAAGFTLGGGVVGAMMVLRYGGLGAVAATNGYALAGGAAVGGAVGLTAAMVRKGKSAAIPPGSEIRIKLEEDLSLPTVNMPDPTSDDFALEGLSVKILGLRLDKDPFGEMNELTLSLDVQNFTEHTFSTFEIGLEDEFGNTFYPSPFGDSGMWFSRITPNGKMRGNLTFNVDTPKGLHKLVFFKQYTREPVAKFALTDKMLVDKKAAKELEKKLSKN